METTPNVSAQARVGTYVNLPRPGEPELVDEVVGFVEASQTFLVDAGVVFSLIAITATELPDLHAPTVDPRPRPAPPAASPQFNPVPWAPGGRAGYDPPTREAEQAVQRINATPPHPWGNPRPSVVPLRQHVDDEGKSLLPKEARSGVFLSAKAPGEIATLHKWERDAAEFIRRTAAAAAAKAAKQKALGSMGAYDLRTLCRARGMVSSASAKKPALVAWLEAYTMRQRSLGVSVAFGLSCSLGAARRKLRLDIATNVCSFLTPHDGRDNELEFFVALDRDLLAPPYMPPISIPDLIAYVARLECLNQQRRAAFKGYYYVPLVDQPARVIDPDHVMHSMMTKVVWGQDPLDAGACVISLERLTADASALNPPDEVLNRILARGGDKHPHACSLLLAIHPRLQKSLRALGHVQDATVLEAVGRCWRAWKERLFMSYRLEYLWELSLVIHRVVGSTVRRT